MGFFSDEDSFKANGPYIFNWQHILIVSIFTIMIIVGIVILYKKEKKVSDKVLVILWIIQIVLEFTKIGLGLSYHGIAELRFRYMPIHLCSMFMYVFPFFMWGKGRIKQTATAFCSTYMFFGGLINFIIPSALYSTPAISSFFGLHTMVYHGIMVFCGLIIAIKYYKLEKLDFLHSFLVLVIVSIPALVFDYVFGADYMFFSSGVSTPLTIISNVIPYKWLWSLIMYALYLVLAIILQTFVQIIIWIVRKVKNKKVA